MSAMAKMFADIILKEIPPEIREAITPENIAKMQENVTNLLAFFKSGIEHIAKEQLEQRELLERILENVSNSNSGKPGRVAGSKRIAGPGVDTGSDS